MGMGLTASIFLTIVAIVLWQLSSLAKTDACRLRPICMSFLLAFLLLAVNSSIYFFPAPVFVELLIAICLAMTIFASRPRRQS